LRHPLPVLVGQQLLQLLAALRVGGLHVEAAGVDDLRGHVDLDLFDRGLTGGLTGV
jgi:hypothetical protein